jgi:WD40 repeat protein
VARGVADRPYEYDAFVSYSHAADAELAPVLQSHLQAFAKPWYKLRSLRVFRDETTLAVTPHLWPDIRKAMDGSRYFVLLCSPRAAQSRWVAQEVSHWLSTRGPDSLLLVLTEGTIAWDSAANDFDWNATNALPPTLKGALSVEPKWEDVSALVKPEHLSMQNPVLRKTVASIYSVVTGKPLDAVIGEDVRQFRRTRLIAGSTLAAVLLGLVGFVLHYQDGLRKDELDRQRIAQQREERLRASARYVAEQARQLIERGDTGAGLNLALEDLEHDADDPGPRPIVSETHMTLFSGLHSNMERTVLPVQGQADIVSYSAQGTLIVSTDRTVQIFDPGARTPKRRLVHEGKVLSAVFSKDGKRVLTASRDRRARIWDIEGNAEPKVFAHTDEVVSAQFDPTETMIATGSRDDTAAVWDVATGQRRFSLQHEADLNDVVWADGGKRLFSITTKGTVRAFDAASGSLLLESSTGTRNTRLARISISLDGTRAVSSGGFGAAVLWDTSNGTVVARLSHGRSHVTSAVFSPTDDLIVTTGSDLRTAMWETKKGTLVYTLLDHSNVVSGSAFSPDGSRLVTFSEDRTARVYAACDGRSLAVLRGHADEIVSASFTPDGCGLTTGSGDATVRQWSLIQRPGQTMLTEQACMPGLGRRSSEPCKSQAEFATRRREVLGAAISQDGKWVATASLDRIARIYDATTGQRIVELPAQQHPIRTVAFDSTGKILLTGQGLYSPPGEPGLLRMWDWRERKELIPNGIPHTAAVQDARFSADDSHILTASGDGQAQVFDAKTGALQLRLQTPPECRGKPCWLGSANWSPDGKRIATASFGGKACLWDVEGKSGVLETATHCVSHRQPVYSVAWNSRSTHIVTGSGDNTAVVWDARSGEAVRRFVGEDFDFRMVAFFDNDRQIISANDDYSIRFWYAATGREAARLLHRQAFINFAAMDKSGQRLLTASADGITRIWWLPATLDELAETARSTLQRCLSSQQRGEFNLIHREQPRWCAGKLYGPFGARPQPRPADSTAASQ